MKRTRIVKLLSWVETSQGSWDIKYYLEIAASSSVETTPIPPFAGTYRVRSENLTLVLSSSWELDQFQQLVPLTTTPTQTPPFSCFLVLFLEVNRKPTQGRESLNNCSKELRWWQQKQRKKPGYQRSNKLKKGNRNWAGIVRLRFSLEMIKMFHFKATANYRLAASQESGSLQVSAPLFQALVPTVK